MARNWRLPSGDGEADLIAWEGEELVIVEVNVTGSLARAVCMAGVARETIRSSMSVFGLTMTSARCRASVTTVAPVRPVKTECPETVRTVWLSAAVRPSEVSPADAGSMSYSFGIASEIAVKAADDCVQIHGGYGFVKDYPAEKYFRDVKLTTIGEGTSEIQRLVIARQLLAG